MAKLILRPACFNGIQGVYTRTVKSTVEHKRLVDLSNKQIVKNRTRYVRFDDY